MHNLDSLKGRGKVAGPGHWNDPDFLEVGVEGMALTPTSSQQTLDENRAHMSMWCITSAPLIAGLRMAAGGPGGGTANQTALDILTNNAAIAINQQYAGHPGRNVANITAPSGTLPVQAWVKPQPSSKLAVYVVNPSPTGNATVKLPFATLGLAGSAAHVRDIWARADIADATGGVLQAIVPPMDSVFLLLEPTSGGEQVEAA